MPSVEEADWLASRIPDCHVKVLPDSGHVALLEDGICLATLLREAGFAGDRTGGALGEGDASAANGVKRSVGVSVGSENGKSAGELGVEREDFTDGNGIGYEPIASADENGPLGVRALGPSGDKEKEGQTNPGSREGSPETDGQKAGGRDNPGRQTEDPDFADALKDNQPERKLRDDLAVQLRTTTRKLSEGLKERKSEGSDSEEKSSESTRNSLDEVESNGAVANGSERKRSSSDGIESKGKVLDGSESRRADDGSSSTSISGRSQESLAAFPETSPGLPVPVAETEGKTDSGKRAKRTVPIEEVNRWRRSRKARKGLQASNPILGNDFKWLQGVVGNMFGGSGGRETGVGNARGSMQALDGTAGAVDSFGSGTDLRVENGFAEKNEWSREPPRETDGGTRVVSFLGELSAERARTNVGESRERTASTTQSEASRNTVEVGGYSTGLESNRRSAENGTERKVSLDGAVAAGKPFGGVRSDQPAAAADSVKSASAVTNPSRIVEGSENGAAAKAKVDQGSLQVEEVPVTGLRAERNRAERNGTELAKEWTGSEAFENMPERRRNREGGNGAEKMNGARSVENGRSSIRGLGAVEGETAARESENGKATESEKGRVLQRENGKDMESGNGRSTEWVAASADQSLAEDTQTVVASPTGKRESEVLEGENEKGGTVSGAAAGEASPPVAKKAPEDLKAGGVAAGRAFDTMLDDMPQYRLWNWLTRPEFYGGFLTCFCVKNQVRCVGLLVGLDCLLN